MDIKKLTALIFFLFGVIGLFPQLASADSFYFWRYRTNSTNCASITDGRSADLCFQDSNSTVYKCKPTDSVCDTPEEWKLVSTPAPSLAIDELNPASDNTALNATTSAHGLLPKLDGDSSHFLNGQGGWTTPAGGGGGGASVSDTAFDATWDGATTVAPSQNAVYDYLNGLSLAVANITITPYSGSNAGSVAVGKDALKNQTSPTTSSNVGLGNKAGDGITTGTKNVCLGYNTCGGSSTWNVAVGDQTMSGPLSALAIKNTMVGANVGLSISDGTLNTCVGYHSCTDVTTSNNNTAIGVDSLHATTTGGGNSTLGYQTFALNTTGAGNIGIGSNAFNLSVDGDSNIGIGSRAGGANRGGDLNIYIGHEAGYQNTYFYGDNRILIGNDVALSTPNAMQIGNTSNTVLTVMGAGGSGRTLGQNISFPSGATKGIGVARHSTANTAGNNFAVMAGGAALTGAATISQTPVAGGSGYVVGDILSVSGGDSNAQVWVSAVSGGVVTEVSGFNSGSGYSVASPVSTTGGTGTGCTVNITAVTTTTDKNGGSLLLQGGMSKGTGTSNILLQVPSKGTTGTADNTMTTFATVDYNGLRVTMPSTQTISAGSVVTADACGAIKALTASGSVTTDTTNTFTAPASANSSCIMQVCNVGSNQITLDHNSNFKTSGGTDVVLGADYCVTVGSSGGSGIWRQLSTVQANS